MFFLLILISLTLAEYGPHCGLYDDQSKCLDECRCMWCGHNSTSGSCYLVDKRITLNKSNSSSHSSSEEEYCITDAFDSYCHIQYIIFTTIFSVTVTALLMTIIFVLYRRRKRQVENYTEL